jgi:predicted ArsR family transcriptional regulator
MPPGQTLHLSLDRRLLRHPRAYHLRRMRMGLWLYLDLLARLPAGANTLEVEPAAVAAEMGVEEGFVRSWLGHLSKAGYVDAERLNGSLRVRLRRDHVPEPFEPAHERLFTVAKLQRALGDTGNAELYDRVLRERSDAAIRKALADALAVPEDQIRRSRTALFVYLLNRHAHAHT